MVAHQLGYKGSPSALASQVHVTSNDQVGVLQISANEPTGAEAVRLVDAFDRQLIAYLNDQIAASYGRQQSAAHAQLQAVRSQIATLQTKARRLGPSRADRPPVPVQDRRRVLRPAPGLTPQTYLTVVQQPVAVPGAAVIAGTSGTPATAGTTGSTSATSTATTTSHSTIPQGRSGGSAAGRRPLSRRPSGLGTPGDEASARR